MDRPARIGKYAIVGELGKGGMGVVYKGHDPVIRRDVALKVIRKRDLDPNDAEHALERFKREAQAAGNLAHPNIVAIYEYGEDEENAFIAATGFTGRVTVKRVPAPGFDCTSMRPPWPSTIL
jgi:serine/threonine-protein kinase